MNPVDIGLPSVVRNAEHCERRIDRVDPGEINGQTAGDLAWTAAEIQAARRRDGSDARNAYSSSG
ncbi:MAG: hypothetical protein R2849_04950 [Thermomicrobiales bacterium]